MMKRRTKQKSEPERMVVYGAAWCEETTYVRRLLESWDVPYHYIDVDMEPAARNKIARWTLGCMPLPIVTVGALETPRLFNPTDQELQHTVYEQGMIRVGPLLL